MAGWQGCGGRARARPRTTTHAAARRSPLFVTWHKASSRPGGQPRLRGCIGTLEARQLRTALGEYALTSALRDRRFSPVEAHELPHLSCTVSLLHSFEAAAGPEDWEIGTHGEGPGGQGVAPAVNAPAHTLTYPPPPPQTHTRMQAC